MVIVRVVAALACVSVFASSAPAAHGAVQMPAVVRAQTSATVMVAAPVFLKPDRTLTPLRTLAVGTTLMVERVEEDWVQVTFNDRQFGRRLGWIERRSIRMNIFETPPAEPKPTPAPLPGQGQARPGVRPAIRRQPAPIGLRLLGSAASDSMSAAESFRAVTGSDRVPSYGGGIQVTNLWHGLYAEVAAERSVRDGQRVFVSGDDVFALGIPLRVRMTPIDVVGGWRSAPVGRFMTYGGAGMTFVRYEETSDFADADENENVKEDGLGVVAVAGVEVRLSNWVHVRGEGRYRRVNDVLGLGGASAAFEETRLGGFGGGLKIVLGR